jgi:hypothetical protein
MTVLDWLLDSDPAMRWRVLRDPVHAPAEVVAAERARILGLIRGPGQLLSRAC